MRVIITGGSGLIGGALARDLARAGHEVVVLSRNPGNVRGFPSGVRPVGWDGRTAGGWGNEVEAADVIVNLAGESIAGESLQAILLRRWTPDQKRRILESRLNAGKAVIQAIGAAARKPRLLIQSSAVGYYGPQGGEELAEEALAGDDTLARICVAWEDSTLAAEGMGMRRLVIRTGVVLSPTGGVLPLVLLPFRLFVGGRLGSGRQWFPWIHIADEVGAIRFLMDTPSASGAYNLTAPQALTNVELSRIIGRVMRRPAFVPVPGSLMRLALGEKATIVLQGQRPTPRRLRDLGYTFRFPDVETALKDLVRRK
jgi:uncharacterized protein (TIGR01777 family)